MSKVLIIQAHPHIDNSLSLTVGNKFIEEYKKNNPNDTIILRDLYDKEGVPPLNDVTMAAWKKQKNGQTLTVQESKMIERHNEWLDEFINADKYVFINPMYNHFLPAEMKQYLDLTAIARKTFKYTPKGSVGLLKNKKAIHIQASGSVYHKGGKWGVVKFFVKKAFHISSKDSCAVMDLGSLYLQNMLKFYGINDIDQIYVEGADAYSKKRPVILKTGLKEAVDKAKRF
ncbi:NAD(P)H-dependent oxidoreductase [Lactobacillus sp.]|uniref:FMN-dependent NADH-azoreductase n=1 Tax=Lactobacillus sp. TaxID=1591 RepID=UPI0019CE6EE9|nr:NAD(P)H-dependent oxidoreductase [Lactobacillus sp.]MBD5429551.1 FMN-dependent NADH-azoreductase [Lactobacillus sp.]